jgi:predicted nucleic acid-binding protein
MQSSDDLRKKEISNNVINSLKCIASTQVLNELCNIFTKKYPIPESDLANIVNAIIETCQVNIISTTTIKKALQLHVTNQFSYYDSLMLASALESNCRYLFSEDMQDGQIIEDTLTIIDIYSHPEFFG